MLGKAFAFILVSCSFVSSYAAQLLKGTGPGNHTFTFNIGAQGFYNPAGRFFVGARTAVENNEFAVAVCQRNSDKFRGITPEKVRLNGQVDAHNPLFGAGIKNLAMLGGRPVVTKIDDPSSLFLIESMTSPISVYAAYDIHDAHGEKTQEILGITTSASSVLTELESGASLAAFAAVANKRGHFDGDGSGIALLFFKKFTNKENKSPFFTWDSVDAKTGASQFNNQGEPIEGGNRAFHVGKHTPELAIHDPLTSVSKVVDLHFDRDLGRLYVALQVIGGADSNDGARAVLVASLANGRLQLLPIAHAMTFQDQTKIVGGRGSLAHIRIFKVRTLATTTYLRYLIVVGGNGQSHTLKSSVFALPLVDNVLDPAHGTLANVSSQPLTIFSENAPYRFLTRVFTDPAKLPADLYSMDSPAAKVGGYGVLPGPITDITVSGDAVFVSVDLNGQATKAGIFHSQAFFDSEGRIQGWTAWQRVAGSAEKIAGFSYDPFKGEFWYIPGVIKKNEAVRTKDVLRTEFTRHTDPLSVFISQHLFEKTGGVQGLFDFPVSTPSFTSTLGSRLAVNAFTGYKKVLFMQTGADDHGFFGPNRGVTPLFESHDGTLTNFMQGGVAPQTLAISGGVLDELGPIGSCAVVTNGVDGWFVVGGSHGVAILADSNGHGWDAGTGLMTHFQGLRSSMAFRKISEIKNVRKLISSNSALFVLTDVSVVRLTIHANLIAAQAVPAGTIAKLTKDQQKLSSSYSDLIVAGPLAVLATSFGLFRSGNAVDVQTVTNEAFAHWQPITLAESAGSICAPGPVSRLYAISPTNDEAGLVQGGTIFALNAYVGLSQAQIYRLAIAPLSRATVTNETVTLVPDFFIKDLSTFFAQLGDYRNFLVTDGALIAVSRSAYAKCKALLELLPPTLKSGQPGGARSRVSFVNVQENSPGTQAHSMGKLLRDSASGSWMVPGDFGIRIQQ